MHCESSSWGHHCVGVLIASESIVHLLVEEFAIALMSVWIVTREHVWGDLLVRITEVDIAHIISIVQEIWVEGVIVPEVMLVILSSPMSFNHVVLEACHAEQDICPEECSNSIEVGVTSSQ